MASISRLTKLFDLNTSAFSFHVGIERETLRVDQEGALSQKPHPESLGSALTHSAITTDYSEALVEFITGVHDNKTSLINELDELHRFSNAQLDNEYLWAASMPSPLPEQEQIPIAQYGSSDIGRLKTIYRKGLWHRYGRKMQTIAGLHYNWSMPEEFWQQWANVNGIDGDYTSFKTDEYFGLIRGFRRHSWLLLYLFGSSPAADKSFLDSLPKKLKLMGEDTIYAPYATSLRMSDMGYSNKAQKDLHVCVNSLETYAETLTDAINEPFPEYEDMGVKVDGDYKQLNANILQIENEYYSDIRPKRVASSGEKPIHALRDRGVEYIEVRCLDIDPNEPLGISESQMDFVDVFLLWCLVQDNPPISSIECKQLNENNKNTALFGRDPDFNVMYKNKQFELPVLAKRLLSSIHQFAEMLDEKNGDSRYAKACDIQLDKVLNPNITPSAKLLEKVQKAGSFKEVAFALSSEHSNHFAEQVLSEERTNHWQAETILSLEKQRQMEAGKSPSFDEFLTDYLRQ